MERRFLLFLLLSFALLTANSLWNAPRRPQQPAADAEAAAEAEGEADKPVDGAVPPAEQPDAELAAREDAEVTDDERATDDPAAAPAPEVDVPLEYVTLGSVDDESPYRMLVTLTNRGAAVRRVELASPRYVDMHDRGGYLGSLELATGGGEGLLVQAVGAGTPAAVAGLKVGDRLLEAGGAKLAEPVDLAKRLADAKPKSTLKLAVQRDGSREELDVVLQRRPLEVIRPESENVLLRQDSLPAGFVEPPSFLLTLAQVDEQKVPEELDELPALGLRDANWRLVPSNDASTATFERRLPALGLTITKRYILAKAPPKDAAQPSDDPVAPNYDLTLEISIANDAQGGAAQPRTVAYRLDGPNGLPVEGWWFATKIGREWSAPGLRDVLGRYVGGEPTQLGAPAIVSGDAAAFESAAPLAYMGVDAQYFCVALIPLTGEQSESWIPRATGLFLGPKPATPFEARLANVTCRLFSKPLQLAPGDSVTHKFQVFHGPKRPRLLEQYQYSDNPAYSLGDFVYYGWFGFVAKPMLWLLHGFYRIAGNYGIAIIMLTVLVRGCMFPLSRGQAKSMMKMQELRPEMDRIKERYKGDQQKQAQAMQQLYRKHGVNPLAGCLPMLIQLPVFIGLYRGLAVDVELRGAPLFGSSIQWCSNLAAPDMLWNWSHIMPDFINRGDGMFSLGPYLNVLPLITIALWIVQQKMFTPPAANEQAEMQQKIMKYMMIFMAVLFYKVPSGLCLYFIASSAWGIAERKLMPPLTPATEAAPAAVPATGPSGGRPRTKTPKRRA